MQDTPYSCDESSLRASEQEEAHGVSLEDQPTSSRCGTIPPRLGKHNSLSNVDQIDCDQRADVVQDAIEFNLACVAHKR